MTAVDTRTWTLAIPAPEPMKSANAREHWRAVSRSRRKWREAAYLRAAAAKLPRGLRRVCIDVELRFTSVRRRDAPNYHPTVIKPIVDALGPQRIVRGKNGTRVELGWGLIPDDTAEYLDLTVPHIGDPVPRGSYPHGLVVLTITDLIPTRCERVCFGGHTDSQSAVTSGRSSSDPLARCEVDASTTTARTSPGLTQSPRPFDPHGSGSRGTPGTGVFHLPPQDSHVPGGLGFRPPSGGESITQADLRVPTRTQPTTADYPQGGCNV